MAPVDRRGKRVAGGLLLVVVLVGSLTLVARSRLPATIGTLAGSTLAGNQRPAAALGQVQAPGTPTKVSAFAQPPSTLRGRKVTIIAIAPVAATAVRVNIPSAGWVDLQAQEAGSDVTAGWRRWTVDYYADLPPGAYILPVRAEWAGGAAEAAVILSVQETQ